MEMVKIELHFPLSLSLSFRLMKKTSLASLIIRIRTWLPLMVKTVSSRCGRHPNIGAVARSCKDCIETFLDTVIVSNHLWCTVRMGDFWLMSSNHDCKLGRDKCFGPRKQSKLKRDVNFFASKRLMFYKGRLLVIHSSIFCKWKGAREYQTVQFATGNLAQK